MNQSFQKTLDKIDKDLKIHGKQSPLQCKPKIILLTRTAKGIVEALPKPKSQLYRTKSEGRNKQIMPTRAKKIKLKTEYWRSHQIQDYFRSNDIFAERNEKWFVHFNNPHRKMTAMDQLEIMLQKSLIIHLVHYNFEHKHFIIESLAGND